MSRTLKLIIWLSVGAFLVLGLAVPLAGTFAGAFAEGGGFTLRHIENVTGYRLGSPLRAWTVPSAAILLLAGALLAIRLLRAKAAASQFVRYSRWLLLALPAALWLWLAGDWSPSDDARRILTSPL